MPVERIYDTQRNVRKKKNEDSPQMNAAAVFISLLFWGWLWDVWGMRLGIPIIVIVKVVSEHVEELLPVAKLLGE